MKSPQGTIPNSLEKALFEIVCIMIILVMMHGMIQGFLIYGPSLLSFVELGITLVCAVFLYLVRFKGHFERLRLPLVFLVTAFLIFFWFWLSGYFGPSAVGALGIGIICIVLLPSSIRIYYVSFFTLLVLVMVFIQMQTDWVRTSVEDYETLPYDYSGGCY